MTNINAPYEGDKVVNLEEILSATTVESVTTLIEKVATSIPISWEPVGGRSNNLATINIGSDPAAGLTERITNAIDAVLEREWHARGAPTDITSPRHAVQDWFGVPHGRLDGVDARDPNISSLSERVTVTLLDSGSNTNPTVDIRDRGIGLRAHQFGTSILGLNESLKLDKFFLAGAYGQGGSTALSFSTYAIILSRRVSGDGEQPNPLAFTIVRFNERDLTTDKHGLYEYLVDRGTGQPIEFSVSEADFEPGTLVRHVRMDLGKYHSLMTAPTGSLWYLTHHYLFDPVLPFRIVEGRPNSSRGANRFVGGNFRRLTRGESANEDTGTVEYQRSATVGFRNGQISLHWWVLSATGDLQQARNRITNYVLPSRPIVLTFNGQKQGDLPNTVIKNDLRLPYLERYLVVQVNCDGLDPTSRRQLFSTTRESLRDSGLLDELRNEIVDKLNADDELRRLDAQRKQRYMRQSSSESTEHLRRRLANRLRTFIRSGAAGPGPTTPPADPPGPGTETRTPIPVQDPPTFLQVTSSSPHTVYAGKSFRVHFKTDADPTYFIDPDAFMAVVTPPAFGRYTGSATVHNGYGIAYFQTNEDVQVGDTASIALEVRPPRQRTLSDTMQAVVEPLPEAAGRGGNRTNTPNLQIVPVDKEHAYYIDNNWTESSVAKAEESAEETTVYVSVANSRLGALIQRAQRRSQDAVENIRNFYIEHIAFHALLVELGLSEASDSPENDGEGENGDGVNDAAMEKFREQELRRACETICGVIDATFDVVLEAGPAHAEAR